MTLYDPFTKHKPLLEAAKRRFETCGDLGQTKWHHLTEAEKDAYVLAHLACLAHELKEKRRPVHGEGCPVDE